VAEVVEVVDHQEHQMVAQAEMLRDLVVVVAEEVLAQAILLV
jgi:hypothetical protein